ncbi:hypothetical protein [Sporosarcina sp. FSL K6-2383]|uniref:hypothetical protein n=1 Tax=Sporosarcina sp. FSL K6-2383 TaxID=2921556 RepID=UPI003159A586
MKNRKWWVLLVLILISLGALYLLNSSSTFHEKICEDISAKGVTCTEVLFIDNNNNLMFFKDNQNLRYAKIDDDLNIVEVEAGRIILNEFPYDNIPLSWVSSGNTLLWGLASEDVHSILITGDNDIQPNMFKFDRILLWYQVFEDGVKFPVLINAYDKEHVLIFGKE